MTKADLLTKTKRNLSRETKEVKFLQGSIEHNRSEGREIIARELEVKLKWRIKLSNVYSDFITDLKSIENEN